LALPWTREWPRRDQAPKRERPPGERLPRVRDPQERDRKVTLFVKSWKGIGGRSPRERDLKRERLPGEREAPERLKKEAHVPWRRVETLGRDPVALHEPEREAPKRESPLRERDPQERGP